MRIVQSYPMIYVLLQGAQVVLYSHIRRRSELVSRHQQVARTCREETITYSCSRYVPCKYLPDALSVKTSMACFFALNH